MWERLIDYPETKEDERRGRRILWSVLIATLVFWAGVITLAAKHPPQPTRAHFVLVGQGCGPSKQLLVAREEDEFGTTCDRIDAHWLRD